MPGAWRAERKAWLVNMKRARFAGSLLGLAVCDAVGTTVEFMPPGSFDPVEDMVGGGKFNLLAGQVGICMISVQHVTVVV